MNKTMTPQEVRKRWVAALRSGKYQQGRYFLRNADNYCVLGVLCDLHAKQFGFYNWEFNGLTVNSYSYGSSSIVPPLAVLEWVGLNADEHAHLVEMNDEDHETFEHIADVIESGKLGAYEHRP